MYAKAAIAYNDYDSLYSYLKLSTGFCLLAR
jgi:hypothetical protein